MKLISVALLFISMDALAASVPIDQLKIVSEVGQVTPSEMHGPREGGWRRRRGWRGRREGWRGRREGWRGRYERWSRQSNDKAATYPSPKK